MSSDYKSSMKSQSVGFYKYHDAILGKGNFATVYLARHKVIGCEVALKVINIAEIEEEYLKKNLDREACILRGLQHPNIIRLYEVIKSFNLYCLSLEVIRGVNLYQYMMNLKSQSLSEKLARIFFYQMLSGVEYMHRVHVIHRDLKLENILVEYGHVIKIVDFGLSNIYYPTYVLRTHCGSVEYAAPELFKSMSVYGTAADVWSLGVILYAMVVGKMPFKFCQKNNKDATVDNQETSHKRDRFVKRLSKGLMQENWELMEQLSSECWDLLHEMLQPDQFRRIHIEKAISHPWITKDENLKKRLPQCRRDLERKFHSEIVNYLALKLNTSTSRIEKHIQLHPFDKIGAMFYIARDILVKEVLHPPQKFESSFLYRFECWRCKRSKLYSIEQTHDYREKEMNKNYNLVAKEEKASPKYGSAFSSKVTDNSEFSPTSYNSKIDPKEKNLSPCSKNSNNQKERENPPLKISRKFVTFEKINVDCNNEQQIEEQKQVFQSVYRSYKNSRPKSVEFRRSKDKSIDKQLDEKHQTENQSAGENLCENNNNKTFEFPKGCTEDSKRLKKLFTENKIHSNTPIIPYSVEPNERISKIPLKSKSSESKLCESSGIEDRTCYSDSTQGKSIVTSNGVKCLRRKPRETTVETLRMRKDSANFPGFIESQAKRNNVNLLTRTYQPSNHLKDKKEDAMKKSEFRGRIPIQNFQLGNSSPHYPTLSIERKKSLKRAPVADRIDLCQGDTKKRDS